MSIFTELRLDNAVVKVVDEGKGLADDIKENLFKPHITSKSEGAGMGLFIVKRLSQLHYGGDVELHNRAEGGCEATLTLQSNKNQPTETGL